MKRMLTLILALMLLCGAALAEAPVFGPDALLLQQANAALTDKYGLTHEALGLFNPSIKHCGDSAFVTYTTNGSVPDILTGEYTVLVSVGSVQAFWTHDGVDAALWQSGDLNSPAWGVKQLTAYLDEHPYTRASFCDPYEQVQRAAELKALTAATDKEDLTPANRESANAASEAALAAVQVMYSLTDEETANLHWVADLSSLSHYRDGHSQWHLMFQEVADVLDPISYYVTLDADTHVILYITHSSGGVG